MSVERRPAADGNGWLCLARKTLVPSPETMTAVTAELENVAGEFSGEYDGWQAAVVE